jgi:hypothetical protein
METTIKISKCEVKELKTRCDGMTGEFLAGFCEALGLLGFSVDSIVQMAGRCECCRGPIPLSSDYQEDGEGVMICEECHG